MHLSGTTTPHPRRLRSLLVCARSVGGNVDRGLDLRDGVFHFLRVEGHGDVNEALTRTVQLAETLTAVVRALGVVGLLHVSIFSFVRHCTHQPTISSGLGHAESALIQSGLELVDHVTHERLAL